MKEPCIDCPEKNIDKWGYFCDIHCGKRSAWLNHQVGIREVVEWVESEDAIDRMMRERWRAKLKEWGIEEK